MGTGPYSFAQESSAPASQHQSYIQIDNRKRSLGFFKNECYQTHAAFKGNIMLKKLQNYATDVSANRIKLRCEYHKET